MPIVSGRELCKLIRSDPRLVGMPIIMVTSKCLEFDVAMLRGELGLVDVLPKPFSPRELLKSVQNCIASRQQPAAAGADSSTAFGAPLGRNSGNADN
jgi:DNA-binding response OmpR family regulator